MARFVFMMLDGVGVGALPDATAYGDEGSDTLGNLSRAVELHLPHLQELGLGNLLPLMGVPPIPNPRCLTGRLSPVSVGKDTTVGHWEHMGLVTSRAFPTYPRGFPPEVLAPFEERIGRAVLGNKPASGTAIIAELGGDHLATGKPIVYTSADSVFQIAAHIDVVPLDQLYEWCQIARDILREPHGVARVIARPFTGRPGAFVRTKDRRDFSLPPPAPTYLDLLHDAGVPVVAMGKISEIFAGRGVTTKLKVASNEDNLQLMIHLLTEPPSQTSFKEGLLFTNLVDFDMTWGHRNDSDGFAQGLAAVDRALPELFEALGGGDRLIITADHGVDPTTPSTDHSREYVPLLLYPPPTDTPPAVYEGCFSDTGATVFESLTGKKPPLSGQSVLHGRPTRGWRRYTPSQSAPTGTGSDWPGRVGSEEAQMAARFLHGRLGEPPEVVVVLGSGLAPDLAAGLADRVDTPYCDVPHWRAGAVEGHDQVLSTGMWNERLSMAILRGRIHGYEGFDLSELQLPLRSLACWGVPRALLTTACGAVAPELSAGGVVFATAVIDLQFSSPGREPALLRIGAELGDFTSPDNLDRLGLAAGLHAGVPGPQYETFAELSVLRSLGASCVSMSGPAEIRAAADEHLESVLLCQVTNCGATTHGEVLAASAREGDALAHAVEAVLGAWVSDHSE